MRSDVSSRSVKQLSDTYSVGVGHNKHTYIDRIQNICLKFTLTPRISYMTPLSMQHHSVQRRQIHIIYIVPVDTGRLIIFCICNDICICNNIYNEHSVLLSFNSFCTIANSVFNVFTSFAKFVLKRIALLNDNTGSNSVRHFTTSHCSNSVTCISYGTNSMIC